MGGNAKLRDRSERQAVVEVRIPPTTSLPNAHQKLRLTDNQPELGDQFPKNFWEKKSAI